MSSMNETALSGNRTVGMRDKAAPSARRLAAAALSAFAAAFLVNLGIRWFGQAELGAPDDEPVLSTLSIALTTLFGAAAASVGLSLLAAQATRPLLAFRRLAALALLLSLLGPLAAAAGWVPEGGGVGLGTFLTLTLMHVASMAIIVAVLTFAVRGVVTERRR